MNTKLQVSKDTSKQDTLMVRGIDVRLLKLIDEDKLNLKYESGTKVTKGDIVNEILMKHYKGRI